MIIDISDLEPLLTQYESDTLFVGPLLSLSINANYRYFYLAGNGSKIYRSIGLGFLEDESDAQKQRSDILEKLKPRFAQLLTFDSHAEMARAVRARWRTEETFRVLAEAEREAKATPASQIDNETTNKLADRHALRDKQSEGLAAQEPLEDPQSDDSGPLVSLALTPANRPTDSASMAEQQRCFVPDRADNPAVERATALEDTKVDGQESLEARGNRSGIPSDNQFRELAGLPFSRSPRSPDQADGPAAADMSRGLLTLAGPSVNHEATKLAGDETADGDRPLTRHEHVTGKLAQGLFAPNGRDERPIRLPTAANLPSFTKVRGESFARRQQRDFRLTEDDIASAILSLEWSAPPDNDSIRPAELRRSLAKSPAILAAEPSPNPLESAPTLRAQRAQRLSIILRLAAVAAAIMLLCIFVLPSTRQDDVDKAADATPAEVTNSPSNSAETVLLNQLVDARRPAQQPGANSSTVPAQAEASASQVENSDARAAPVSDRHEPVAPRSRTADRPESEEIAKLVNRAMESLKSGNFESARLSLRRAVEAIPSPAGAPSQVDPSNAATTMAVTDTKPIPAVKQPSPQTERSSQIKPSSHAPRPAQVASLEPRGPPPTTQTTPARGITIAHIDPDEIAILVSRGMDFLKSGDFASARVSLRRAAEAGNAKAALALGSTYDPSVLRQLGAVGVAADVARARHWYEKAAHFGSAAAVQRLVRLARTAQ